MLTVNRRTIISGVTVLCSRGSVPGDRRVTNTLVSLRIERTIPIAARHFSHTGPVDMYARPFGTVAARPQMTITGRWIEDPRGKTSLLTLKGAFSSNVCATRRTFTAYAATRG